MIDSTAIQFEPLMEADPVAFSMDTTGWKAVFTFLIIIAILSIYKWVRRYRKNIYRRNAIGAINSLITNSNADANQQIVGILFQLKQTALISYERNKVAALQGSAWLQFLDEKVKGSDFKKYQDSLESITYKNVSKEGEEIDVDKFAELSINWIKRHA